MINKIANRNESSYKNISFGGKTISGDEAARIAFTILDDAYLHAHKSPDWDGICSLELLYNFIRKNGKNPLICIKPTDLFGLFFKKWKYDTASKPTQNLPRIVVDCNDPHRASQFVNVKPLFVLDHHSTTKDTFDTACYIDDTAKSTCSIIYRFYEALNKAKKELNADAIKKLKTNLTKEDYKNLYCGMLSDYQKSGLIKFENSKLIKLETLYAPENVSSREELENVEKHLNKWQKLTIYRHLDILSNLTSKEKILQKRIFSEVKVTKNGKLAYVVIDPKDKLWEDVGGDNIRTSDIIRDLRLHLIGDIEHDPMFSNEQKKLLKNVEGSIVFYESGEKYQMSITSKDSYAEKLINYVKNNINSELEAGGHPERAGGRIYSLEQDKINKFVNDFLIAAEKIDQIKLAASY